MIETPKDGLSYRKDADTVLQIAVPADLLAFIDRHRHAQNLKPSREETVVSVLRAWAGGKSYWNEIQGSTEGLRPEQLNATNDD